jgi:ABC-type sugar transport system permease subunit
MDALRVFDVFQVMFGEVGCYPGNCRMSMAVYEYENVVAFAGSPGSWGYGAAISVGIFLILAVVIVIYIKAIPLERAS